MSTWFDDVYQFNLLFSWEKHFYSRMANTMDQNNKEIKIFLPSFLRFDIVM